MITNVKVTVSLLHHHLLFICLWSGKPEKYLHSCCYWCCIVLSIRQSYVADLMIAINISTCYCCTGEDVSQLEGDSEKSMPQEAAGSDADRSPTFIVQPEAFYYVTRSKPTTITCRAVNAVQINFKCVSQWVPPTQHQTANGVETAPTRRRYIQVSSSHFNENVFHNRPQTPETY